MKSPLIQIVIIYKKTDKFVIESVRECLKLAYDHFEILLLPDEEQDFIISDSRIRVVNTGKCSIPEKRNIGIYKTRNEAEYIAFLDSDAYPDPRWLTNSLIHFRNEKIVAVGGPDLTPANECYRRKISGFHYSQYIGFGPGSIRHSRKTPTQFIKELPTCNLIIRKGYLAENPFNEKYMTNEDAKLCSMIHKNGYKILFANDVIVYHHRRKIFMPLVKQTYFYGLFKADLLLSGNLSSPSYLLPFLFVLFLIAGISISLISDWFLPVFCYSLGMYFLILFLSTLTRTRNPISILLTVIAIFFTHLSYGLGFMKSLCRNLLSITIKKISIPTND